MATLIREYSTITVKGQTTVPKSVRQALGVDYGGRIAFSVNENGVTVHRADDEDPAIASFLNFLSNEIKLHPETLSAFSPSVVARINELTAGMKADIDGSINGGNGGIRTLDTPYSV